MRLKIILSILNLIFWFGSATAKAQTAPDLNASGRDEQSFDSLFTLYQPYLENIHPYEPIYFLCGTAPEKSNFQFSFKYQLFNQKSELGRNHPWTRGINFAYTQTSFWDLRSESKPFKDSSYKPELFFLSTNLTNNRDDNVNVFLQSGVKHESNGKDEQDSRSINICYLKPILIVFNRETRTGLQIAAKVWTYFQNDEENNPDIEDYRGYLDLEIKLGRPDRLVMETHFLFARAGESFRLDLSYPLRNSLVSKNIDLYLHAQYVYTLAENLISYRQRTEAVRIGFSLVR